MTNANALLERPGWSTHIAQVYRDEDFLARSVACFIDAGLRAGEGAVVLCTLPRWERISAHLERERGGHELAAAAARLQLYRTGVHSLLLNWMSGQCSQAAFDRETGAKVELLLEHAPEVRVFSEMADLLLEKHDRSLAAGVQRCWNHFIRGRRVAVLSAWHMASLDEGSYRTRLESLYLTHDHVLPDPTPAVRAASEAFDRETRQ